MAQYHRLRLVEIEELSRIRQRVVRGELFGECWMGSGMSIDLCGGQHLT